MSVEEMLSGLIMLDADLLTTRCGRLDLLDWYQCVVRDECQGQILKQKRLMPVLLCACACVHTLCQCETMTSGSYTQYLVNQRGQPM